MTTPRVPLTDALLKDVLTARGAGPRTAGELVEEVLTTVRALPPPRRWSFTFSSAGMPLLATVVLMSVLIAFAVALGGDLPSPDPVPVATPEPIPTPAPPAGGGDIVYVQATYRWDGWKDHLGWSLPLVDEPRILIQPGSGGAATVLADVPAWGGEQRAGVTVGPIARWSPDGSRLAFELTEGAPGIYVVNRDGSGLTRVIDHLEDSNWDPVTPTDGFAWSPDGTSIAAVTYTADAGLYLMNLDDGTSRRLTDVQSSGGALPPVAWSPDGTQIAFARSEGPLRAATHGIFVISADGTGERRLVEVNDADLYGFGWSPDGTQIAFMRSDSWPMRDDLGGVWVISADGTGLRKIGSRPGNYVTEIQAVFPDHLVWSPDGRWIDVPAVPDRSEGIVLVAADGSGERIVGGGLGMDQHSWSPDWSHVVFSDAGRAQSGVPPTWDAPSIYIMNADGTGLHWLADGEYPDWSR
jgi:hypothetical protein